MRRGRELALVAALFLFAIFMAGLVAPWVFNGVVALGRTAPWLASLRDTEFEGVVSRCALAAILIGAIPAVRVCGLTNRAAVGFPRGVAWRGWLLRGLGLGVGTMVLGICSGWLFHAYLWTPGALNAGFWGRAAGYLVGAMLVGYIEEYFFRGVIFGILRRGLGVWPGALLASLIYAGLHFAKPEVPIGVAHAHWYSGFEMLPYLFTRNDFLWEHSGYMFWTLWLMGLSLCLFYAAQRHLYFCIGLHAGWVWIMRSGVKLFERNWGYLDPAYGPSMVISKSGIALGMAAGFAAIAAVCYARRALHERRAEIALGAVRQHGGDGARDAAGQLPRGPDVGAG